MKKNPTGEWNQKDKTSQTNQVKNDRQQPVNRVETKTPGEKINRQDKPTGAATKLSPDKTKDRLEVAKPFPSIGNQGTSADKEIPGSEKLNRKDKTEDVKTQYPSDKAKRQEKPKTGEPKMSEREEYLDAEEDEEDLDDEKSDYNM